MAILEMTGRGKNTFKRVHDPDRWHCMADYDSDADESGGNSGGLRCARSGEKKKTLGVLRSPCAPSRE